MTLTLPLPGGCNCGAIRFVVTRQPLTAYICHCHLCQKRTGSPYSLTIVIPRDGLEFVAGEPMKTERFLDNGTKSTAWTCPSCYSRIHSYRDGAPAFLLRGGTLDNARDMKPVAQFWTSSALPWALFQDDVLSYTEQPTDYMPLMEAWRARTSGT